MLKLTSKGKELYEAIKNMSQLELLLIHCIKHDEIANDWFLKFTYGKEAINSLISKGLIEEK